LRIRFDADLTQVLPHSVAQVEAVKDFHQYFQDDRSIIILMECEEDQVYQDDAAELASFLSSKLNDCEIVYQSQFDEDPDLFAKEVAHIWATSEHSTVQSLIARLSSPDSVRSSLQSLKADIKTSFQTGKAIKHSYDPFGFMQHPGLAALEDSEYSFESDDGRARFLFVKSTLLNSSASYTNDALWVDQVKKQVDSWNQENDNLFQFGYTGSPVFNAEVGAGMQQDMLGTVAITLSLIALLFLVLQRSFSQLLLLIGLIATTFFLTLGIAGWIIPSLNMLSVAFAAILLGLVIDYAVVLLRESKQYDPCRRTIRRGLRGTIIWAAITTSGVFSILMLSSFPGVQQLGILILIGLACGAYVMLYAVPWYIEKRQPAKGMSLSRSPRYGYRVLMLPTLLLAIGVTLFFLRGTPQFSFSLDSIQPQSSQANLIHKRLSHNFSSWSDLRTVVFSSADSPQALQSQLVQAATAAEECKEQGLLTEVQLPAHLIPYPDAYEQNIKALRQCNRLWSSLHAVASEEGFTSEALKYDQKIIQAFNKFPASLEEYVSVPRPHAMTKSMYTEHEGKYYFRGNVTLKEPLSPDSLSQLSALNSNEVIMTGWSTLSATLEPVVRQDFQQISIPAAITILIVLGVVFRNLKECLLVLFILVTALISVNAAMVLLNIEWNFLNIIAFPLIIGVGIDYSIHLIFAMRRQGQQQSSIWGGVGLAITFCGASSVIGFGSLTFANNDLLQSLGAICASGVLITMVLSLLVIPPVWRAWCHQD